MSSAGRRAATRGSKVAATVFDRSSELALLAGRFLYVMVFGVAIGVLGTVQQVVDLHKSPWFWLALMLFFFVLAFAVIAYRTLVERDRAPRLGTVGVAHAPLEGGHSEVGHEWEDQPGHRRWERRVRADPGWTEIGPETE
jgi:hypothetical protein